MVGGYWGNKIPRVDKNQIGEGTPNNKPKMSSESKTTLPQVGTGNPGNPTDGSDRVQAPVAIAGSKDFGGSQDHENTKEKLGNENPYITSQGEVELGDPRTAPPLTARKMKKPSAWEEHEQLIAKLVEHLSEKMPDGKPRRTVIAETRNIVDGIQESFRQIRKLMQAAPKAPGKQADEPVNQRIQQPSGVKNKLSQTPGETKWYSTPQETSKRKERSPPSPSLKQAAKKASLGPKAPQAAAALPGVEQIQEEKATQTAPNVDEEMEWQLNTKKKKKKNRVEEEERKNPQKDPPKSRRKKTLPKALLISAKDETTYADILKKVKDGLHEDELEESIDKIRRTNNDQLLIVLNRRDGYKMEALQEKVAGILGNDARVTGKSRDMVLSIRDLEETTTKEEVKAALQKAAGDEFILTNDAIRALHPAYKGTQIASIKLPEEVALKVIGDRGKIRIGLVNCPIKEVTRTQKCFKCWNTGHIASKCLSQVDRSGLCLKCGQAGHKIADCLKDPHCLLCAERDKDHYHIVGSYKCAVSNEKNKSQPIRRK